MESKSIFTSKTFWANAVALIAMIVQGITGKELLPLETQGVILSVLNIILRTITKSAVDWS
jgi:hypothetical protein